MCASFFPHPLLVRTTIIRAQDMTNWRHLCLTNPKSGILQSIYSSTSRLPTRTSSNLHLFRQRFYHRSEALLHYHHPPTSFCWVEFNHGDHAGSISIRCTVGHHFRHAGIQPGKVVNLPLSTDQNNFTCRRTGQNFSVLIWKIIGSQVHAHTPRERKDEVTPLPSLTSSHVSVAVRVFSEYSSPQYLQNWVVRIFLKENKLVAFRNSKKGHNCCCYGNELHNECWRCLSAPRRCTTPLNWSTEPVSIS